VQRTGAGAKHSQQQMIERTKRRVKEATRLRRRKVQSTTTRRKRDDRHGCDAAITR